MASVASGFFQNYVKCTHKSNGKNYVIDANYRRYSVEDIE